MARRVGRRAVWGVDDWLFGDLEREREVSGTCLEKWEGRVNADVERRLVARRRESRVILDGYWLLAL